MPPNTPPPLVRPYDPPSPRSPADFYYELGVQVVEACITSRAFTGGLVELSAVHKYVQVGWLLRKGCRL